MKKLAIIITCLIPVLSFASNGSSSNYLEVVQERCAKEKDPIKRQYSCHMLDRQGKSQLAIPDFHRETATV